MKIPLVTILLLLSLVSCGDHRGQNSDTIKTKEVSQGMEAPLDTGESEQLSVKPDAVQNPDTTKSKTSNKIKASLLDQDSGYILLESVSEWLNQIGQKAQDYAIDLNAAENTGKASIRKRQVALLR